MQNSWYSNGKLMLTGEYSVLSGAVALALPVKFGQSLRILDTEGQNKLNFTTYYSKNEWFNCIFKIDTIDIISTSNSEKALYLQKLLKAAKSLNHNFLINSASLNIIADINFNPEWGLGTSSSLISNIAYIASVDAFKLNNLISSGSGYDIACARSNLPILYSKRGTNIDIQETNLNSDLTNNIWFVYLGRKQNTNTEIHNLTESKQPSATDIYSISDLSYAFTKVDNIKKLMQIIDIHETITSNILQIKPIKETLFQTFDGAIKSLGAWGGDFCMAVSERDNFYVKHYFEQKGLATVFNYNDIAIKK